MRAVQGLTDITSTIPLIFSPGTSKVRLNFERSGEPAQPDPVPDQKPVEPSENVLIIAVSAGTTVSKPVPSSNRA
jgi:hypothetical protein